MGVTNRSDNAFHVIISVFDTSVTIIDGFSIIAGVGGFGPGIASIEVETQTITPSYGGGIYIDSSFLTIRNNIFTLNQGFFGGGIYNTNAASPSIKDNTFTENSADSGAGIANAGTSNPTIEHNTFDSNSANTGGGIFDYYTSPTINDNTFTGNTASNSGGAICNYQSSAIITNNIFDSNVATDKGGAIFNQSIGSPIIDKNLFLNNSTTDFLGMGGAITNEQNTSPIISNCVFYNNTTAGGGGGIDNKDSSPSIINSVFYKNTANSGGAIYNENSSPSILHSSFLKNVATVPAGGAVMYNTATSSPIISNTIMWQLSPIMEETPASCTISYSVISGGYATGTNIIISTPLFTDINDGDGADNIWCTADDGLTLKMNSPGINEGNPATTSPATDITGLTRIGIFDTGAYEYPFGVSNEGDIDDVPLAVKVFPNPTREFIHVSFSEPLAQAAILEIYDVLGKRLGEIYLEKGETHYQWNTSMLNEGIYFFRMNQYEGKFVIRN